MKNIIYNTGYFIKEAKTIFKLTFWSNVLSLFSIGLILFILSLVISGWSISTEVLTLIQEEAQINIYTDENLDDINLEKVMEKINSIDGIIETRIVQKEEAYERMEKVLGEDAKVLEYFEDNPFHSFFEAKIDIEKIESIHKELKLISEVRYIRDNREILTRLRSIARAFEILGAFFIAAVGISTVVIISHIIRQGIYNYKEEINTLRLLGASEAFIALPFLIVGLLLTFGGGAIASTLTYMVLIQIYNYLSGPLPFIPLPPFQVMMQDLVLIILSISIVLGIIGSMIGISSSK
ncbi:cell division protein FtsX [Defluviitalea raffinosedens]|jgi:cell division transport system permease protein|uniref:cell division protein FtsX n=1 Tax=Defluviitalea raffinosedens TaxID=1450156 RepID=UPI00195A5B2A|nr:permease-like cell division protein FtsX [Defluviitalea raffinosedens]MBM7687054.1 cell division transport system permease protein [Defluviitalea raffinosedens]MBZ4667053.1 hypothetical protein [Defluviitaleaceae bacterium]